MSGQQGDADAGKNQPRFRVDINTSGVKVEFRKDGKEPKVHEIKAADVNRFVNETAGKVNDALNKVSQKFDACVAEKQAKEAAKRAKREAKEARRRARFQPASSPMAPSGPAASYEPRGFDPRQAPNSGRSHMDSNPINAKGNEGDAFTGGDLWMFILGIFLFPIWLFIAVVSNFGPAARFIGNLVVAAITSVTALISSLGQCYQPKRLRKTWAVVGRDWALAGRSGLDFIESFVAMWGLSRIIQRVRARVVDTHGRYREYRTKASDVAHTPEDFRDKYHVVDQLPSGGSSARIYVVRRVGGDPNELLVLKHFDVHTGSFLENVFREGKAVELAKRMNLIVDSQMGERSFYYVMPYYRGDTFTRRVLDQHDERNDKRLPKPTFERTALGWVHQLLQLISQYHDAGVFHKDIKPDNLIVNNEYLFLVDIGLLTEMRSDQQLTTHGTEYFRDPEMVKLAMQNTLVRDVNVAKFDIYSIGAVLFFAFDGEFPVNGSLSRFSREVPRAVQMVVQKAMANFDKRYDNARQMLADVDHLCFAASQNRLAQVRPGDLPSFRASVDAFEFEPAPQAPYAHPAAMHNPYPAPNAAYHVPSYQKGKTRNGVSAVMWTMIGLAGFAAFIFVPMLFWGASSSQSHDAGLGYNFNAASQPLQDNESRRVAQYRIFNEVAANTPLEDNYVDLRYLDRVSAYHEIERELRKVESHARRTLRSIGELPIPVAVVDQYGDASRTTAVKSVLSSYELMVLPESELASQLAGSVDLSNSPRGRSLLLLQEYQKALFRVTDDPIPTLPIILVLTERGDAVLLYPGTARKWKLDDKASSSKEKDALDSEENSK